MDEEWIFGLSIPGMVVIDWLIQLGASVTSESADKLREGNWEEWPQTIADEWRDVIQVGEWLSRPLLTYLLQNISHMEAKKRLRARDIVAMDKVMPFVLSEAAVFYNYDDGPHAPAAGGDVLLGPEKLEA